MSMWEIGLTVIMPVVIIYMILRLYQKEMDKMEDIEDEDEDGIGGG